MSDTASKLADVDARVVAINIELEANQQEIDVHEAAKREAERAIAERIARRMALRKEREGLSRARESLSVKQRIATEEEAATKARQDAENLKADLAAKNKEADELIAKLKAAAETKPE